MQENRKKLIQDVIDRLLYSEGYEEKLIQLNREFEVNVKIKYKMIDFKFNEINNLNK